MNPYASLIVTSCLATMPLLAQTPQTTAAPNVSPATEPPPVVAAATAAAVPDQAQPLATAVLNFQSSDEAMDKQGAEFATVLQADMSATPNAILVERQDVAKILDEQEFGKSGLVSADTAAKIGSLTGAQVLVTGRLFATGNQYMVVAKIIGTETSRVYGVTATISDLANLPQAALELSGKIDAVLASHRDVLVAHEESPDKRLERLRGIVGQRPLPSVTVSITERDYTQPTIDPAAQTEIMMQLQALGFQVIGPDEIHKKADILISGEAFSELGARHGNLVSSLGRIELRVTRTSSGELLWTDRETRVAVDLGSRTAGKEALQKGAQILIERLVPKLTK